MAKAYRFLTPEEIVGFIESYLVTTVHPEGDIHHIDDKEWQSIKSRILAKALKHKEKSTDFARRIANTMNSLRSSHAFFIIQQAYSDMEWEEAQSILDEVIKESENEAQE